MDLNINTIKIIYILYHLQTFAKCSSVYVMVGII